MPRKVKLSKLSICHCGFTLLNDCIKKGQVFTVYPAVSDGERIMGYVCGGCGCFLKIQGAIFCDSVLNPENPPSLLPLELFDFSEVC